MPSETVRAPMAGETGQRKCACVTGTVARCGSRVSRRPVRDDAARLQMIRMSIVSDQARKATELQLLETVAALASRAGPE